jgi:hypothetical protein
LRSWFQRFLVKLFERGFLPIIQLLLDAFTRKPYSVPEDLGMRITKENLQAISSYELVFERTLQSIKSAFSTAPPAFNWSKTDCRFALELTDQLAFGWHQQQAIQTQLNAIKAIAERLQPPERTIIIASLAAIESWSLELQDK